MLGLPLNVTHIFFSWISSMLFSDFKAWGLRSIPTPPVAELTEFFHADADTTVHPFLSSWYFSSSSLWYNLCSCMYMIFIFYLAEYHLSSADQCSNVKVAMLIVFWHLSNLGMSSEFSNIGAWAVTSAECCSSVWWAMQVDVWFELKSW